VQRQIRAARTLRHQPVFRVQIMSGRYQNENEKGTFTCPTRDMTGMALICRIRWLGVRTRFRSTALQYARREKMPAKDPIVAVALMTAKDLRTFGGSLQRVYTVAEFDGFDDLLDAIDAADTATLTEAGRTPAGSRH
jgi:hypothetical protein